MLTLTPRNWWSYDQKIVDEHGQLTTVRRDWFRENRSFTINGQTYTAKRSSSYGSWELNDAAGNQVALADKSCAWNCQFTVEYNQRRYIFSRPSSSGAEFVLSEDELVVGRMDRASWWSGKVSIDLPEDMPMPVRVFIVMLGIFMWQHEEDQAVALENN